MYACMSGAERAGIDEVHVNACERGECVPQWGFEPFLAYEGTG